MLQHSSSLRRIPLVVVDDHDNDGDNKDLEDREIKSSTVLTDEATRQTRDLSHSNGITKLQRPFKADKNMKELVDISHSIRMSQIRVIMRLLAHLRRARIQKISLIRVVELRDSVTVCSPDHEKRVNDHLGLDHLP